MQKKIEINEDRTLYYSILKDNPFVFQVREDFKKDGYPEQYYYFNRGKNYEFGGYTVKNDITDLLFEIDIDHPLYIPFIHLLSDDEEVVINDDTIKGINRKYIKIYQENEMVIIKFVNNLMDNKNKFSYDKFNVFVKNTEYDRNSKIDQLNPEFKDRLHKFFIEVNNMMYDNGLENDNQKKLIKKRTS